MIVLISCIPYNEGIQFLRYEKTKNVFQNAEPETVKSLCESLVKAADSQTAAALKVRCFRNGYGQLLNLSHWCRLLTSDRWLFRWFGRGEYDSPTTGIMGRICWVFYFELIRIPSICSFLYQSPEIYRLSILTEWHSKKWIRLPMIT